MSTRIVTIGTFKGGVGKTTSVLSIAGILAERGYNVLCIDVDPQGNLTRSLGINRSMQKIAGIEKVFDDETGTIDFSDIVIEGPVKDLPLLDLIPSSIWLHRSALTIANATAREYRLRNFIEDNKVSFDFYDYVLVDTNPSMDYLNQNAFLVSDAIIIPMTPDLSDVEGAQFFCATWDSIRSKLRVEDNIAAAFITKMDKRISIDNSFEKYLTTNENVQDIASLLLKTIIPVNATLKESSNFSKPINIYNKKSTGYKAYIKLVDELFERGVL